MKKSNLLIIFVALCLLTGIVSAADGTTYDTIIGTLQIFAAALGAGAFGAYVWYVQKRPEGEAFDWKKFWPTLRMGLIISVFLYFIGGTEITVVQIQALLTQFAPLLGDNAIATLIGTTGLFGAVYATGYRFIQSITGKTAVTTAATTAAVEQAETIATVPAVAGAVNWLSFKVTPTFPAGVSPFTQLFKFYATQPQPDHPGVVSVDVDWDDGKPIQNVPMKDGYAEVSHIFEYSQGYSAYFAKVFRPVFTVIGSDGSRKSYNLTTDGFTYMCGVEVTSIITGTKPMPQ